MHELIAVTGAVSELLAIVCFLCAIGSAMMNGIAQSNMGGLLVASVIFGIITTICLG